jgi:hypothetical protein
LGEGELRVGERGWRRVVSKSSAQRAGFAFDVFSFAQQIQMHRGRSRGRMQGNFTRRHPAVAQRAEEPRDSRGAEPRCQTSEPRREVFDAIGRSGERVE